ncbi:hypothetical protein DM01DRAFT_314997 [Hesseltinella vesiculosa]|uniref:Uncharacterized protein n=1 Tax=Hesseltinella vesiculosa TaxID=101127 RepID=A0A1X2G7A0_9FUNG|nr:hypothetical protein DM01DRAFT_314997 [Hesseltinella vesiculosa]
MDLDFINSLIQPIPNHLQNRNPPLLPEQEAQNGNRPDFGTRPKSKHGRKSIPPRKQDMDFNQLLALHEQDRQNPEQINRNMTDPPNDMPESMVPSGQDSDELFLEKLYDSVRYNILPGHDSPSGSGLRKF